jgi:FecR protein
MAGKYKSVVLAFAAVLIGGATAIAQQVGTATAVNPNSESTPPGGSTITLKVGSRILHKERIHTSPTGSVQLLFVDQSTLNIAPNTNLLIDEFVYDPASGSGHMLTKLTQGTLQYIGGKLSHQGAVTIDTPAATIGIRGGTATVDHGTNGTHAININGTLTIMNGGGSIVVYRPGFVVTVLNWNTPPGQPARVTAEQVIHYIEYLSSKFGQNGGVGGLNNGNVIELAGCGTASTLPCPQPPWLPTNGGEDDALQIIIQSTQRATQPTPTPPPPPVFTGSFVRPR